MNTELQNLSTLNIQLNGATWESMRRIQYNEIYEEAANVSILVKSTLEAFVRSMQAVICIKFTESFWRAKVWINVSMKLPKIESAIRKTWFFSPSVVIRMTITTDCYVIVIQSEEKWQRKLSHFEARHISPNSDILLWSEINSTWNCKLTKS